jgi:hypothetical protein
MPDLMTRGGLRPRIRILASLFGFALLTLAGCSSDPLPPKPAPEKALFTQLDSPILRTIHQRNGSTPPQWIVDVKSTGMALLNLGEGRPLALLLTCGSDLERWNAGLPGFEPLLFTIDGQLQLTPIPGAAGISPLRWTSGCAAADIDGDGDDDLLLTGIGGSMLYRNEGGQFQPDPDSGILTDSWCTSAAFGDLDLDGDLDLFICRYLDFPFDAPPQNGEEWSCLWENQPVLCGPRGLQASQDLVFENLGDGRFVDRTAEWGFENATPGYGLAVTIADLYGDPHPEIFVANDSCPNQLWSRQENGTWLEDGLLSGLGVDQDGQEQAGMGIAVAGLDSRGGLDLAVTNFERESINLYQNQENGLFQDIASGTGLAATTRSSLGWGIGIADFNLDQSPDLLISNGHVYPQADSAEVSPGYSQLDQLFLGSRTSGGGIAFSEQKSQIENQTPHVGRGLLLADLDRDGDVDAITSTINGPPHIYRNNTNPRQSEEHQSVAICLSQSGANPQALGSTIRILDTNPAAEYPVLRNTSFQSSGLAEVILPLPMNQASPRVQVKWPDGSRENFLLSGDTVLLQKGLGQNP